MFVAYVVYHDLGTNYGIITTAGFEHSVSDAHDGTAVVHLCETEDQARDWLEKHLDYGIGELEAVNGGFIGNEGYEDGYRSKLAQDGKASV